MSTNHNNEKAPFAVNEGGPKNETPGKHFENENSAPVAVRQADKRQRREEIKALAQYLQATGGGEWKDSYQEAVRIIAEHEAEGPGQSAPEFGELSNNATDGGSSFSLSLGLLHALVGGEVTADGQILAPGPGHSAHDRSMCVTPSSVLSDGYCVHSFSPRTTDVDCKAYVNRLFREWIKLQDAALARGEDTYFPPDPVIETASEENRVMDARQRWNRADRILGQSVYDYLAFRGLQLAPDMVGRVARFEARGRWYSADGKQTDRNGRPYDASEVLLWACRDVFDDTGHAVQMVRMPHLGMKSDRKVRGIIKSAAIKLTPHEDILAAGELAIAEGFESALAAMMLGYRNVWAVASASNVADFPVLVGVNKLTILAENCVANEKARLECAMRWLATVRVVTIATPDHGKDFNDELLARFAKTGE